MGAKKDNLITIVTVVIIANLTALAWFGWSSYSFYSNSHATEERHLRALELRGIIVHLDEVLTMSARMAAATGDITWEERYHTFEPKLDAAIKEAIALSPKAYTGEAAAKTDTANFKLVAMESRAFDLIRQGYSDSAVSVLFGDAYERQKRIYADGMSDFNAVIAEIAILDMERETREASVKTAIALLLSPCLVFTWFIVFRAIRRRSNTLIQNNHRLAQQADELATLNKNLDRKVAERVKELNCLYGLSRIIETHGIALEEILRQSVRLIPPGWQYPDITCARLLLEDQEYVSDNYQETEWKLSQNLTVAGQVVGSLDVCYLEVRPEADEGPFLREERNLIRAIAEYLQRAVERMRAEESRKLLEKSLFQSDKMASIGQLAAGVAHEINNPVGYISSNLNTMNKYVWKITEMTSRCDLLPSDQREQLDEMLTDFGDAIAESLEGAERVKKIVADLKGFSRTDAAVMQPTNIAACINTTLSIVWNQLKYHCEIKKDFGDLPPVVCHPNQINQVIMNLLINAGQATEGKSGVIEIRTWAEDDQVAISVRDNGCGIPQKNLDRLFDPFFTTKDVGKGTGLGLSLSYGIVQEHDGRIEVTSEVGVGTEFRVILPVGQAKEQTEPAATG